MNALTGEPQILDILESLFLFFAHLFLLLDYSAIAAAHLCESGKDKTENSSLKSLSMLFGVLESHFFGVW